MKYRTIIILAIIATSHLFPQELYGVLDPRLAPNNRFGIHITDSNDIEPARELVNSQGGDWGYVTFVIREDNRDTEEWQVFFDRLRENHLIPIVRIATKMEDSYWTKPTPESVAGWVGFLNSLNWVVQNRYIILFNEPNHAKEWGMNISPEEYATIAKLFHQELKKVSDGFFILPAGLDDAASDTANTMSSAKFFDRMHHQVPEIFTLFDGWVSHSYPNPAFSGSPYDAGSGTIRGFEWELAYVSKLGFGDNKPVFITETGWQHNQGKNPNSRSLNPEMISRYYTEAFTNAWNKEAIVAVTPFILNYPDTPFDSFSFRKWDGSGYHSFYEAIKQIPKTAGRPEQIQSSIFVKHGLPKEIISKTSYTYSIQFINTGQSIWDPQTTKLHVESNISGIAIDPVPVTRPGESATLFLHFPPQSIGAFSISYSLAGPGLFGQSVTQELQVESENNLVVKLKMWLHKMKSPSDFTYAVSKYLLRQVAGGHDNHNS
jgi:hypothetical protein